MKKIRIVTEGSVHFSDPEIARREHISIVPHQINMGSRNMQNGLGTISPEQYLDYIYKNDQEPNLPAPSTEEFTTYFRAIEKCDLDILCLCSSQNLSTSWKNATLASESVMGKIRINVIDTMTTSIGLGMLVETASNAIIQGASIEEAGRVVRKKLAKVYGVFYLDSMQYLQYGGWVGPAQSTLAEMLGVKPIFALESGGFIPFEKVKTRTQALERLMEFATEFPQIEQLTVLRGRARVAGAARKLRTRLGDLYPKASITNAIFGPVLASLIGPDGLGIILCEDDNTEYIEE
tara:strand:+ start:1016 stop:1891 length:876 start_codon:yes stop_codon:yes gene_type:complete